MSSSSNSQWTSSPVPSISSTPIHCSHISHKSSSSSSKPVPATVCCLICSCYLCSSCDFSSHKSLNHHRFPVSQLKSYIDFGSSDYNKSTETAPRANLLTKQAVLFPFYGCTTLYELFQRSNSMYPNNTCLGSRTVDSKGQIGAYEWQTYRQVYERANNIQAALVRLVGLEPKARVGLYSVNRPEWNIAEQACFMQNYITVPLYDTLGPDSVQEIVKQAELNVVFCSMDKVKSLISVAANNPCLKAIIVFPAQAFDPKPTPQLLASLQPPTGSSVKVYQLADLEKAGAKSSVKHNPPKAEDIATLCFTSGTTGSPKGAVLIHSGFLATLTGLSNAGMGNVTTDYHISYLPLPHMFERMCLLNVLASGASAGYSRGNTLLLLEDIEALRPTVFVGVPRLYNRLFDKINSTIDQSGAIKKFLFNHAYNSKVSNLQNSNSVNSWLWDRIIFSKIAARLGGRVRLMVTGSAPISENVLTFLRVCFSCPVIEGFGMTETTTAASLTPIDDQNAKGNVGIPLTCSVIKLLSIPEMKYNTTDVINGIPTPRGEILMKGPNIFQGYYKDAERTSEALIDGWLYSGDIGQFNADGTLKIIDRKKNIFKLSQGEYIAPEKIENVYCRNKYVAQVFIYGDSLQSALVGVIVPDQEVLEVWAKQNQINTTNYTELVNSSQVRNLIEQEIAVTAKEGKLAGFEQVRAFHLTPTLFSVENSLLTPTMKLKRVEAKKTFQQQIDSMYQQINRTQPQQQIKSKL